MLFIRIEFKINVYVCACILSCFSHVWLFETLWTLSHQTALSMEFSRQKYWNGLLCLPPGDLLDTGIKPMSLTSSALTDGFFTYVSIYIHIELSSLCYTAGSHYLPILYMAVCISWRRAWQPTPVFLPGESYGQRNMAGYSPWGCRVGHHWSDIACMHTAYIHQS